MRTFLFISFLFFFTLGSCKTDSNPVDPNTRQVEITDVQVTTSIHEAEMSFTTNLTTMSLIEYGTEAGQLDDQYQDTVTYKKSHEFTITGLEEAQKYYFTIKSWTPDSLEVTSDVMVFQTVDSSDYPLGPVISNIRVLNITQSTANITWDTDQASESKVNYGETDIELNLTENVEALVNDHAVHLSGLSNGRTYYFTAESKNSQGLSSVSAIQNFTTTGGDTIIDDVEILFVTGSTAAIYWRTPFQGTTGIYWGVNQGEFSDSLKIVELKQEHLVTIYGLISSTQYYFKVFSVSETQFISMSNLLTFTTQPLLNVIFPDTTLNLGPNLDYPISLSEVSDLAGMELYVSWDPAYLRPTGILEFGPFITENNYSTSFIEWDEYPNTIRINIQWSINVEGNKLIGTDADGGGVILWLEFETLFAGSTSVSITDFTRIPLAETSFIDVYSNLIDFQVDPGLIVLE